MAERLPRATLKQKIQVLDYLHGPPARSQKEVLDHFRQLAQFGISQATLSTWSVKENELRAELNNNPNYEQYRRKPQMKFPDVTKAVEKELEHLAAAGEPITDRLISGLFIKYMVEFGYPTEDFRFSKGWLYAFKKRNLLLNSSKQKTLSPDPVPEPAQDPPLAINYDEIFNNQLVGFNTRLIHSDDNFDNFLNSMTPTPLPQPVNPPERLDEVSVQPVPQILPRPADNLPYYPTFQNPLVNHQPRKTYVLENFTHSKGSHPNSEKVEKIFENITEGYATIYNSGTSAIMGILSYLNPSRICINNSGYQGTHRVIKLLSKLTGLQKLTLEETDQLTPNSVILLETPMNPEGYLLDIAKFARIAHEKHCFLIVDSTLAPPPLQFPFKHGADYVVYSAVKYLAGVSDLGAGFVVSRKKSDKANLHNERHSLGTTIANFDSFLLLRSLRTYKMRILTQCQNTEKIVGFLRANLDKYSSVITKIHHSSLQMDEFVKEQLNGYFNPVLAIELASQELAQTILTKFNFLSNNPNIEGGETVVELTAVNANFINPSTNSNLLRFSIGCEDYEDIIKDIDHALMNVIESGQQTHAV
ncbi:hypothetical protein OGAPHI_000485 [Ogataea philodendri]|uniref:HTH CENPB-type domain-containing protein n=1 Tax=Ogataea philodendri TaxID=1378263 RepID=A0A9P8PHB2_9ASCO|nr:uncharacterized protein OGAPHI_000485 [Ogataea philodendri]KAH3671262.1 hypothetical protein OGAPHI_000485 [Ogataea philodendri]